MECGNPSWLSQRTSTYGTYVKNEVWSWSHGLSMSHTISPKTELERRKMDVVSLMNRSKYVATSNSKYVRRQTDMYTMPQNSNLKGPLPQRYYQRPTAFASEILLHRRFFDAGDSLTPEIHSCLKIYMLTLWMSPDPVFTPPPPRITPKKKTNFRLKTFGHLARNKYINKSWTRGRNNMIYQNVIFCR